MASSGKQKTTMAKRAREARLRERRAEKKARKDARKLAALEGPDESGDVFAEPVDTNGDEPVGEPADERPDRVEPTLGES
jgi:hypothetical protein